MTEWAGWSFADKDWWAEATGDQRRSEFTKASGTIAIADGDEWDDQPHAEGYLDTFMSWPVNIRWPQAAWNCWIPPGVQNTTALSPDGQHHGLL